jgi:hypothetical protein
MCSAAAGGGATRWRPQYRQARGEGLAQSARPPQPRGAGGRFVKQGVAGRPHARGLKALDPAGQAGALSACARAQELSAQALARLRGLRTALLEARALADRAGALRAAAERRDGGRAKPGSARRKRWTPMAVAPLPAAPARERDRALSEADRRINAVAARFCARRGGNDRGNEPAAQARLRDG